MTEQLVASKFLIPECRPEYIERLHLLRKLRQGEERKLILVSAPPGFGKTTLLAEWVAHLTMPCAWLSLEDDDDQPPRFFQYLIAAIQKVAPNFCDAELQTLTGLPHPPLASVTTAIVNGLAALPHALMIVLDDLQTITDPVIHEGLTFLLDHFASHIHLCVSTRADPPWKIARLRAEQETVEIRAVDLRFDIDEATRFMQRAVDVQLAREDLNLLFNRTEGWAVALQLVAGSLQPDMDVHAFIRSFAGSQRAIGDYLVEEVLNRQTRSCREFLVQTSILDLLNDSLCNTVLARTDSREMLRTMEEGNLFLLPVDEQRRWYRFHQLFRDLLQNQLAQYPAERIQELHRNASAWFLACDDPLNSLKHALKAGDMGIAASIAEQRTLGFLDHGRISAVSQWLASLPGDLLSSWPWLLISRAWVEVYLGQTEGIDPLLTTAFKKLTTVKSQAISDRIRGHIDTIRAQLAITKGDWNRSFELAMTALQRLPENDGVGRCHAYIAVGNYHHREGRPEEAILAFERAVSAAQASHNDHLRVLTLSLLANIHSVDKRDPLTAERICQKLLAEYADSEERKTLPALAFTLATLSQLKLNKGEFGAAQAFCEEALSLSRYWQHAETLRFSLIVLANIHLCKNEMVQAGQAFQEADVLPSSFGIWYSPSTTILELQYHLQAGDLDVIKKWADERVFDFSDVQYNEEMYILYARYLVKARESKKAVEICQHLIDHYKATGSEIGLASVLGDQAVAYMQSGMKAEALKNIARMMEFNQIEGAAVPILRKGPVMLELLKIALQRGIQSERIRKLLDEIQKKFPEHDRSKKEGGGRYLTEHLTEREIEILKMLDSGRSSTEIARQLVVAVSTVRTHIKNIYNKLGVGHRIEAVRKARELHII